MTNHTSVVTEKIIGDTLYIVENTQSKTATETAEQKLKRLILNGCDARDNKSAA